MGEERGYKRRIRKRKRGKEEREMIKGKIDK